MGRASRAASGGQALDNAGALISWPDLARKLDTAMDPFGSLRTVEYQPIFSAQPIAVSVIDDRTFTSGTAAITVEGGEYKLTNPGGETCRLETGQRGRYQPGLIGMPGLGLRRTTTPMGTTVYRWGYFDTVDGFGFKEDSDGLHTFVRRGESEIYEKSRSEWLDPLDGTGKSGRSIDMLDGHVYRMPFAWYGYGTVTFGVMVPSAPDYDDEFVVVDRWTPNDQIMFSNPNLPIAIEIEGDTAGEVFVGGRQYGVAGSLNLRRRITGELRTGQSVGTSLIPLISARVRPATPWNRIPIQVEGLSLFTDTSLDWVILLGATLTGASWATSQFSQGDTSTQYDISATALTGGEIIAGPSFVRGGGGSNIGADSADIPTQDVPVGEPVTLAARSHSGTATVRSALRVAELR